MASTQTATIITEMPPIPHRDFDSLSSGKEAVNNSGDAEFQFIKAEKLHPTFGAQISGVDFSRPVDEEVLAEIKAAAARVSSRKLSSLLILFQALLETSVLTVSSMES